MDFMVKKRASVFFVLIAGIILLVHAVIPHHHHHYQICFHNDISDHDHGNDNKDNSDNCVLKLPVVLPSNREIQEFKSGDGTDNLLVVNIFQEYLSINESILFIPLISLEDSSSGISFTYCSFVKSSLGLRAPPVV